MIITDQFVILNFPKTGSSFVRKVIKSLYRSRAHRNIFTKILFQLNLFPIGYKELMLPHPIILGVWDQHGSFSQIPERHKTKRIISVIRNPYQRFESQYRFKWWVEHSGIEDGLIKKFFPKFPNISIDEYVVLRQLVTKNMKFHFNIPEEIEIGDQSIQFINMYFKNPQEVFKKLTPEYVNNNHFINDMCDVEFLRQENLNEELIQFLKIYGFSDSELEFIRNHEKVNVTDVSSNIGGVLNNNSVAYIEKSEWVLFEMLTSKKINYPKPNYQRNN